MEGLAVLAHRRAWAGPWAQCKHVGSAVASLTHSAPQPALVGTCTEQAHTGHGEARQGRVIQGLSAPCAEIMHAALQPALVETWAWTQSGKAGWPKQGRVCHASAHGTSELPPHRRGWLALGQRVPAGRDI